MELAFVLNLVVLHLGLTLGVCVEFVVLGLSIVAPDF